MNRLITSGGVDDCNSRTSRMRYSRGSDEDRTFERQLNERGLEPSASG
jgi:hypothetical protein